MKRSVILILLIFCFLSCSTDDNSGSSSTIQINPPEWIQGKWLQEFAPAGENGWRFTDNDFIIIQANVQTSQRDQLQQFLNTGADVSASNESTDSTYSVTLNSIGSQSVTYSFTQISETEIRWDAVSNSVYERQ